MSDTTSDVTKEAPSARVKRARVGFTIIIIILILLLAAVTLLFLRALTPPGSPEAKRSADGLEWVRSIYGYGEALDDQIGAPNDVTIGDNGTIWVADKEHSRILGFAPDGSYRALIHQGPAFMSPKAFQSLTSVDADEDGNIWAADFGRKTVGLYTPGNEMLREFGVDLPTSLAARDGRLVVGSYSGIAILEEEGELVKILGAHGKGPEEFDSVQGVAIAEDGTIYATDTHNNRLRAFDRDGGVLWTKQLGDPSNTAFSKSKTPTAAVDPKLSVQLPAGLCLDGAGRLVFVDPFEFAIVVADPKDGTVLAKYGEPGAEDGKFAYPTGIDYDEQRDWFAVADTSNDRVQIVRIPGSGGGPLAGLRRLTTGWWKICGIPLLLLLVAIITTALMRRRKGADKKERKGSSDEGAIMPVEHDVEPASIDASPES